MATRRRLPPARSSCFDEIRRSPFTVCLVHISSSAHAPACAMTFPPLFLPFWSRFAAGQWNRKKSLTSRISSRYHRLLPAPNGEDAEVKKNGNCFSTSFGFATPLGPQRDRRTRWNVCSDRAHAGNRHDSPEAPGVSTVGDARTGPVATAGDRLSHPVRRRSELLDGLSLSLPADSSCHDWRRVRFCRKPGRRNCNLERRPSFWASLVSGCARRPCASAGMVGRLAARG